MKCAIFAIARKENLYIRDWVTYHLSIGFDKIYIFDNNFDGEENFNDVISDFIEKDIVNIINVRNKKCYQNVSYNYAILNLCSKYDWNAFIDIDEFITLKKFKDIKDYFSQDIFKDTDAIELNWMLYNDNNQITKKEGSVLERFTKPCDFDLKVSYYFPENNHCKTIINGKSKYLLSFSFYGQPYCLTYYNKSSVFKNNKGDIIKSSPFNSYNFDNAYIRHFPTKTLEEYLNIKCKRGFCEGLSKDILNINYFWARNERTKEKEKFYENYLKEKTL